MSIFDSLQSPARAGNAFVNAFEGGRERKRQQQAESALSAWAVNPGDEQAFGVLAQADPRLAITLRADQEAKASRTKLAQTQQAAAAQEQQRTQMTQLAQLLDDSNDEASYQRNLGAAKQLGLDVSTAPPNFDPQWVGQQQVITHALLDKPDKVSNDAQLLVEAGYDPGTPAFQQAMVGIINNKYASEYVDEAGNVRRRTALNLPGMPAPKGAAPPPEAIAELKRDPSAKAEFDEAFGKGAADRILGQGGAGGNVSSGFRP